MEALKTRLAVRDERRAEFARLRDTPAFTRDGAKITLLMNAGLAVDLDILAETGAEGIGLFRTEFQFMVSEDLPRLDAQTALYARVLEAAGEPAGHLPHPRPRRRQGAALPGGRAGGQSGARLARDPHGPRPAGAAAPAAARADRRRRAAGALRVMFPLVASVDEFRAARALVDHEVAWAQRRGRPPPVAPATSAR